MAREVRKKMPAKDLKEEDQEEVTAGSVDKKKGGRVTRSSVGVRKTKKAKDDAASDNKGNKKVIEKENLKRGRSDDEEDEDKGDEDSSTEEEADLCPGPASRPAGNKVTSSRSIEKVAKESGDEERKMKKGRKMKDETDEESALPKKEKGGAVKPVKKGRPAKAITKTEEQEKISKQEEADEDEDSRMSQGVSGISKKEDGRFGASTKLELNELLQFGTKIASKLDSLKEDLLSYNQIVNTFLTSGVKEELKKVEEPATPPQLPKKMDEAESCEEKEGIVEEESSFKTGEANE